MVDLEDSANVLEDLVEVAGWVYVVGDLYLEGCVDQEGLNSVPGSTGTTTTHGSNGGSCFEGFYFGEFL